MWFRGLGQTEFQFSSREPLKKAHLIYSSYEQYSRFLKGVYVGDHLGDY